MDHALNWGYRRAYRIGFVLARAWWFLRRPRHEGVLVAIWAGERVLVVRQSYRRTLCFPGGSVKRGEAAAAAAAREVWEEIGIAVAAESLQLVYEATKQWDYRLDHVRVFETRLDTEPRLQIDNREIIEAQFVPASACRGMNMSPLVAEYLTAYSCT